ncbi:MAG: hypothetical protein WCP92_08915 [bacterium]
MAGAGNFVYVTAFQTNKIEIFDISSGANPIYYGSYTPDPTMGQAASRMYPIAAT